MAIRRDQQTTALTPDVVSVLLFGWGGDWELQALEVFELTELDLRALWRRHEPVLRAEAARRGLATIAAEELYDINPPEWLRDSKVP